MKNEKNKHKFICSPSLLFFFSFWRQTQFWRQKGLIPHIQNKFPPNISLFYFCLSKKNHFHFNILFLFILFHSL